jgi:hypothetical protein
MVVKEVSEYWGQGPGRKEIVTDGVGCGYEILVAEACSFG